MDYTFHWRPVFRKLPDLLEAGLLHEEELVHREIAREKVEITKLSKQVGQQEALLAKRYDEMMTLRNHLSSGEQAFVTTSGKAYTNERVKEDLSHRFSVYQTAEKTLEKQKEILQISTAYSGFIVLTNWR